MQIQANLKNCLIFAIFLFFLYLAYLLYFGDAASSKALFPSHFSVELKSLVFYCILAVELAGSAIIKINDEKSFWMKAKAKNDVGSDEFVTKADVVSHQIIVETLRRAPGLTLISEEKSSISDSIVEKYKENNYMAWQKYKNIVSDDFPSEKYLLSDIAVWIDPLDATQEFTEGLLDFVSVMICIAIRGKAKFGIIHRPFANETVWGLVGHGVYPPAYVKNLADSDDSPKIALISRSHAGASASLLRGRLEPSSPSAANPAPLVVEPAGGAGYKALRVLNGTAALYAHATHIKKWDVCALDAVLQAAGGHVTDLRGADLQYTTNEKTTTRSKQSDELMHVLTRGILASLGPDHFKFLTKLQGIVT